MQETPQQDQLEQREQQEQQQQQQTLTHLGVAIILQA
eukprot:CAMPEP_0172852022 /NCGR_PEP_ID=MMETSP1075-20121228/51999_1 /TAXON_ID=2916 /ORGANISM="Ceratium fusus, Strain PA161109" /LENGTH=36 /DNA_ID= /DNA_START= /DNA_END= /DNA_ORIENTATION=